MYSSETSKHRALLQRFCIGEGCDIGFGGDPISENAIRVDLPLPYAQTGTASVQLGGDCRQLKWFKDEVLDYVYSSHVLEDFPEEQTGPILAEWSRVLKVGGTVVLLLPDQVRYEAHCRNTGQPLNPHHAIAHFSLKYLKGVVSKFSYLAVVEGEDLPNDYSFYLVLRKTTSVTADQNVTQLHATLETMLAENRRMADELTGLRRKVNAIYNNPVLGPLVRLRAWFLTLVNHQRRYFKP